MLKIDQEWIDQVGPKRQGFRVWPIPACASPEQPPRCRLCPTAQVEEVLAEPLRCEDHHVVIVIVPIGEVLASVSLENQTPPCASLELNG